MPSILTLAAIGSVLVSCSSTGASCPGKCDDFSNVVWKYEAGETPWFTCENETSITCNFALSVPSTEPKKVGIGKSEAIFDATLTPSEGTHSFGTSVKSGDPIYFQATAPRSWAIIGGEIDAPADGDRNSYYLPYDVWQVTVTKLDASEVELFIKNTINLTDASFTTIKKTEKDYLGGISLDQGKEGTALSQSFVFPVSKGGTIGVYLNAGSIFSGPPALTLDQPGCYLANGGTQLVFDENCAETTRLLQGVPQPDDPAADPCGNVCTKTQACIDSVCVDVTPADPCDGACDTSEVCVAANCVIRAEQTQSESCFAPTKACDDDDGDCAIDHACVDNLCRRLSCQTQSDSCFSPTKPCNGENDDCAIDHACVENLCRRLSCQTQSDSCFSPTKPCDGENGDCATDHACVENLCRRLSCQTQSDSCFSPTKPCEENSDCAADHVCQDNLCHRESCQ